MFDLTEYTLSKADEAVTYNSLAVGTYFISLDNPFSIYQKTQEVYAADFITRISFYINILWNTKKRVIVLSPEEIMLIFL